MTPQEILKKAADDFAANKSSWIKGIYVGDREGKQLLPTTSNERSLIDRTKMPEAACFCAVGKIFHVSSTAEEAKATIRFLSEHLNRIFPGMSDNDETYEGIIIRWNDQHSRVDDIIETMKEAAKS